MKLTFGLLILFIILNVAHAQNLETERYYTGSENMQLVMETNPPYTFSKEHPDAQIQKQIWVLEELECNALRKRDTAVLKKLWAHDFSFSGTNNGSASDQNMLLPYYAHFSRQNECLHIKGDVVFAMGYELVSQFSSDIKIGKPVKRRYTNIWEKKNGAWRLVGKFTSPYNN
jgi:hypothetical protein